MLNRILTILAVLAFLVCGLAVIGFFIAGQVTGNDYRKTIYGAGLTGLAIMGLLRLTAPPNTKPYSPLWWRATVRLGEFLFWLAFVPGIVIYSMVGKALADEPTRLLVGFSIVGVTLLAGVYVLISERGRTVSR